MRMIGDSRRPATPPSPEYGYARQGGSVQKTAPSRTKPHGGEVPYRKAASAVPTARHGGSVQKSGLCRTKPHGREVRYRKAASAVPNRTAWRFGTENGPIPYQTARQDRIFANLTRVFEGEPIFTYLYNTYIKNHL